MNSAGIQTYREQLPSPKLSPLQIFRELVKLFFHDQKILTKITLAKAELNQGNPKPLIALYDKYVLGIDDEQEGPSLGSKKQAAPGRHIDLRA